LDEESTVEVTAELPIDSGQVFPVFRPSMVPWFDVDLVYEDDPAIELWSELLREFGQMLQDTGAFRIVRRWRLRLPPSEAVSRAGSFTARDPVLEAPPGLVFLAEASQEERAG
jgi:hypothetical protein